MTNPANQPTRASVTDVADLPPPVRWARAFRALLHLLREPEDTANVLEFSNLANAGRRGAKQRLDRFFLHPVGAQLFAERRALDSRTIDLDVLAALPDGTLGHAYASFMKRHGITPDIFDGAPPDIHDEREAYIVQRIRQTHDLWHVVTNAETDPAGEVALQAFTFAQLGAPSSGIIAALGTVKTVRHDRRVLADVRRMLELGRKAERFAVFPWEDHWTTPLTEVRRLLGVPEHPEPVGGYTFDMLAAA